MPPAFDIDRGRRTFNTVLGYGNAFLADHLWKLKSVPYRKAWKFLGRVGSNDAASRIGDHHNRYSDPEADPHPVNGRDGTDVGPD